MPSIILSACVLVALTVVVHTTGIAVLLRHLTSLYALPPTRLWPVIRRLLHLIWWLILLHLAEISIWGLFYLWRGYLPNTEAAFYFSGVLTRPLVTAMWCWRSRGDCSHRLRAWWASLCAACPQVTSSSS